MRLRRALPLWLVLLSLALGLLATAASVPIASWYVVHRVQQGWWPSLDWSEEIEYLDRTETHELYTSPGFEHWWTEMDPKQTDGRLASRPANHPDDRRPAYARLPYPGFKQMTEYARGGWPLFAAEGRVVRGAPPGSVSGRTHTREWMMQRQIGMIVVDIPLRPMWRGVLANTVFYATSALLLLATTRLGLLALRTHHRRDRGRCVACGYELGASVTGCPECGRAMIT